MPPTSVPPGQRHAHQLLATLLPLRAMTAAAALPLPSGFSTSGCSRSSNITVGIGSPGESCTPR